MVPDVKSKLVIVDLEESIVSLDPHRAGKYPLWGLPDMPSCALCYTDCARSLIALQNIWWTVFPYLGITQHLDLHVVLGTKTLPSGDLVFTWQEDHIFFVESILSKNPILTLGLGPVFMKLIRPLAGT